MKILMFFHGGSRNRGCEAIVRSGVALLKNINPNAEVDLASWRPDTDASIPMLDSIFLHQQHDIKKFSVQWFIAILQLKLFNSERYSLRYINKDIIDKIPNYDIFLSIGGDNYCYGEQPGFYEIDRCIKKAGKKLVLWGASLGEQDLSALKLADLKTFDLLLVRESLTFKALHDNGLTNMRLIADGAFTMDKELLPLPQGWIENNTIGFNFSPLVYKKNKASQEAAMHLVQYILDTTSMTIAFTPHVIEEGNDDYSCLQDFYDAFKATGRVLLLPNDLNAIQYKGYISRMRFFIGARTHATIAAYSNFVPTMVLGYSIKSKGIAKDIFGTERLVLNLDEISDKKLLQSRFDEMLRDEIEIKKLLEGKIPELKIMAQNAAEFLFQTN
ncbi:polysaccharide pyruvyl transferase family protein [Flavobacterium sp.]|jgi:colanic acid/amylovoran biosynthesis protein|uniref:polysaccharide pyruvyl transferase family protein n=1 Tax=Flavobacterium sp. TaxID=239 RepID=UPI0037BEB801